MDDNGYGQPNGPGSHPGASHWLRSHAVQSSNTQIPTFAGPGSDRKGAFESFEGSSNSKAGFDGANSMEGSQQAALDNPFNVPAGYRTTVARATGGAAEQQTDKASRGRQGHENAAQELYMKQPRRSKRGSPRGQVVRSDRSEVEPKVETMLAEDDNTIQGATFPSALHQEAVYRYQHLSDITFPNSAPASSSQFQYEQAPMDLSQGGLEQIYRPSPSNYHHHSLSQSSLPSYASGHTDMGQSQPGIGHSRSASVASSSLSQAPLQFNPRPAFSMSTPTSAASSFGESGSSSSASFLQMSQNRPEMANKTRGHRLTDADRKLLCEFHTQNPKMKHEHIGQVFGVERSTVSKILKNKAKWIEVASTAAPRFDNRFEQHAALPNGGPSSMRTATSRPRAPSSASQSAPDHYNEQEMGITESGKTSKKGRHPELEKALTKWGKEQTAAGKILTDEQIKSKAKEIAASMGIDQMLFKASAGWLENYRGRTGYKAGKFPLHNEASQPGADEAAQQVPPHIYDELQSHIAQPQPIVQAAEPSDTSNAYYGPDWTAPPPSVQENDRFGGWVSPLHTKRRRAPTAMSGSSGSLPGLAEETANEDGMLEVGMVYSGTSLLPSGLSAPHSRLVRSDTASFGSTDSSPYPSPIDGLDSSSTSYSGHAQPFQNRWSTPTQQALDPVPGSVSSVSTSHSPVYRMQQAQEVGLAFQLSLNGGNDYHALESESALQLPTHEAQLETALQAVQGGTQLAGDYSQSGAPLRPSYSLRSRVQSASQPAALRIPRSRQISQPSPLSLSNDHTQEQQHASADQMPVHALPDHANVRGDVYPQKAPLHRSNTDPMPSGQDYNAVCNTNQYHQTSYPQMQYQYHAQISHGGSGQELEQDRPSSDETTRDHQSSKSQHRSSMQADSLMEQVLENKTHHSPAAPTAFNRSTNRISPTHPRRATVSTGSPSEANLHRLSGTFGTTQAVTPTFNHFGMLPRGVDLNEPVSLEDAYMALRKVVGYVHHSRHGLQAPSLAGSATVSAMAASSGFAGEPKIAPGQLQVLEGLLGQFWDAHVARLHHLTPPSSG